MNPVNNIGTNSPIYKITGQGAPKPAQTTATTAPSGDRVELSGMSHLLAALKTNNIRADKVAAIKAQIEAGTYEDDKKLDVAVDRLLDDLSK